MTVINKFDEPTIELLVGKFYDLLLKDPKVNHFFKNTNMTKQRAMQKSFLLHVLNGAPYNGKGMRAAHKHLKLTDEHFGAVAESLVGALKQLNVVQEDIDEIMAFVATTHDDVLGITPAK
jgi:hemoglobin